MCLINDLNVLPQGEPRSDCKASRHRYSDLKWTCWRFECGGYLDVAARAWAEFDAVGGTEWARGDG